MSESAKDNPVVVELDRRGRLQLARFVPDARQGDIYRVERLPNGSLVLDFVEHGAATS